jgi:ribosomal protein L7Ae-like RNA K-turn-binding protein
MRVMPGPEGEALALIGIAARAGAVVFGAQRVREASRDGHVRIAIVAGDASENSRDRIVPALQGRGVPVTAAFDRNRLGAAIGRSAVSAVGVTDGNLARRLLDMLGEGTGIEPRARRDGR